MSVRIREAEEGSAPSSRGSFLGAGVERVLQAVAEGFDLPERLLQVVRGDEANCSSSRLLVRRAAFHFY